MRTFSLFACSIIFFTVLTMLLQHFSGCIMENQYIEITDNASESSSMIAMYTLVGKILFPSVKFISLLSCCPAVPPALSPAISQQTSQKDSAEINGHIRKLGSSSRTEYLNAFINSSCQQSCSGRRKKQKAVLPDQICQTCIQHGSQHGILKNMCCFSDNMIQQCRRYGTACLRQKRLHHVDKEKTGPVRMYLILHRVMPDQKHRPCHKQYPKKFFHKNDSQPLQNRIRQKSSLLCRRIPVLLL